MGRVCLILAIYALVSLGLSALIRSRMEGARLSSVTEPYEIMIGVMIVALLIASALIMIRVLRMTRWIGQKAPVIVARWG